MIIFAIFVLSDFIYDRIVKRNLSKIHPLTRIFTQETGDSEEIYEVLELAELYGVSVKLTK